MESMDIQKEFEKLTEIEQAVVRERLDFLPAYLLRKAPSQYIKIILENYYDDMRLTDKEKVEIQINDCNKSVFDKNTIINCQKCKDKGFIAVLIENKDFETFSKGMAKCKCIKIKENMKKLDNSDIARAIKNCSINSFQDREHYQVVMKEVAINYAKNMQGWCFFFGQSGSGKSHLGISILGDFILKGLNCEYLSWKTDIPRLKALKKDEEYSKLINKYNKADVLLIDDLFKGNITAVDIDIANSLLEFRDLNKKMTILTSELYVKDIANLDEALAGRIAMNSNRHKIEVGKDINKNWRFK